MLRKAKKNRKQEEKNKKYQELFDKNDVNGDGVLSPPELRLFHRKYLPNHSHIRSIRYPKSFFRVLLNGINMKMSQAEIDELIEMIDSNRDGEISRDEFVTFFKKLKLIK